MALLRTDLQMQDEREIEILKRTYFLHEKSRMDYRSAMDHARRQGEKKGIQKSIQIRVQMGENIQDVQREIIGRIREEEGMSDKKIADLMSLTPQQLKELGS
jgi:hypothetical protein